MNRIFVVSMLFGMVVGLAGCGMCANEEFARITSTDGRVEAVVFERNCGATTGHSTQVSILREGRRLPNEGGNVLVMGGHPDQTELRLDWHQDTLVISGSARHKVFQANQEHGEYPVRFEGINIEGATEP